MPLPYVTNIESPLVNAVAAAVLASRIMQSIVHVGFVQTNTVTSIRLVFFFVQIVSFLWLIAIIVLR